MPVEFDMNVSATLLLFVAWAAWVAVCDVRSRRIPNLLVVAGLVTAYVCALSHHSPLGISITQALLGSLVGLAALLPFFLLGMMGAADVKVFAVLGAWCGMHPLLNLWLIASIAAGVHALWLLIVTRTRVGVLLKRGSPTFALAGRRSTPFAAFLTVPTILWLASQVMAGGIR